MHQQVIQTGQAITLVAATVCGVPAMADDLHEIFAGQERPSLNFYGVAGLIDMPSGEALPDGQFTTSVSSFAGITRSTLTFQATPRIQASFRYVGIEDWNTGGFETYRDRNFDVRFLANRESRYFPAVTIGLQDFAGTGVYSGEFIAATKNFESARIPGKIKVTAGLGWGRLGTSGDIGTPFGGNRGRFSEDDNGGELSVDSWFRGPAAPFGGVEWQVNDKLGLKAEYSSDAYLPETVQRDVFTRKSRFNFGAEYQVTEAMRLGAYYLYGSEFGVNVNFQLNPKKALTPRRVDAPMPVVQRPSRSAAPDRWETDWVGTSEAEITLRDRLTERLAEEGMVLESFSASLRSAEIRYRNERYKSAATSIGRVARVMAASLPATVETFRIVSVENNLAQSAVVIQRSNLERLEFSPEGPSALLATTQFDAATPRLPGAVRNEDLYPDFSWSLGPYIQQSYFDPDEPLRADIGAQLKLRYTPAPGWTIAGSLRQRIAGNISDSSRSSNSVLPRVRTDAVLYAREGGTAISSLYASKQWKAGNDVYARVSGGYLEQMYGGVSAEVLWKPVSSRLALGAEANYVKQRDYDQMFGFRDYSIATGHLSAYYEFGQGYQGQVDVGRYLAGDYGATFRVSREFANGWKVGGFFTLTDVSADDFGEGSFDKGIELTIPVNWFLGEPDKRSFSTTIRPIQRDGGARLNVPGRLYEQVRSGHRNAIEDQWSGVWE
ncbi:MAG: YjbH domain-containing protein [Sulfitobacter sp.]